MINMTDDYRSKYDEMINTAATMTNQDERRKIYEDIQLQAQQDAVVLWAYQGMDSMYFQEWMKGYYCNPAYSQHAYTRVYALSKERP
jgi:ABC-type transport system substrate-binding protein